MPILSISENPTAVDPGARLGFEQRTLGVDLLVKGQFTPSKSENENKKR